MKIGFHIIVLLIVHLVLTFQSANANGQLVFDHYTVDQGLPSLYVKGITQDKFGFIWLSTRVAVCRFDGIHYKEFPAYDEKNNPVQLIPERIYSTPDSMLVCSSLSGNYFYFDFEYECFKAYTLLNNLGFVQAIVPFRGGFWVCRDGKLFFLSSKSGTLSDIGEFVDKKYIPEGVKFLNITVRGEKLVAITDNAQVFVVDLKIKSASRFDLRPLLGDQPTSIVYLDSQNFLWLADSNYGLFRFDLATGRNWHFSNSGQGNFFIASNLVHCVFEDTQKQVWIGTEGGLLVWSNTMQTGSFHQYEPENPQGLNTNPVYNGFCDKDGNVWLGTYFGGVNLWRARKNYFTIWKSGINKWELEGKAVSCIKEDRFHNLWIAFEDMGLCKLDVGTGNIVRYTSNSSGTGLSYNNLHDLLFLSDDELWIATYTGGINILNPLTGKFRYINRKNEAELPSDNIYSFYRWKEQVFISTSGGIVLYDLRSKKIRRFKPDQTLGIQFESICRGKDKLWFSSSRYVYWYNEKTDSLVCFDHIPEMTRINFVKADSKGRIWVGDCYSGLCSINEQTNEIKYYNTKSNFPASWVFSLEEAKNDWIWVSSDKGLIKFNPGRDYYELYDNYSGVTFNQFNFRSSGKDTRGNIYFGGINGMVSFNENEAPIVSGYSKVYFTGMQLFNRELVPGPRSPIKASLNMAQKVELKFDQNVFTIEFASINYSANIQCKYAYYLENFEKGWNYVGNRNFATYTNLNPGTYYFHVKGYENYIQGETQERILKIVVKPPFYLTIGAFLIYFILICLIGILIYRVGKRFEKSKALVALERLEKEHTEEITRLKLDFFTNISHELKTPLTLILGPLGKMIEDKGITPGIRKKLAVIDSNAQRLFHLVNQLLEFRKAESGKEDLHISNHDLCSIAEEFKEAFEPIAESRTIEFKTYVSTTGSTVWLDIDKIRKVIFNLLSNAFKFSHDGGCVELLFNVFETDEKSSRELQIVVSDSGKGIRKEMRDKVFEQFFQVQDGDHSNGTGIGLAYAKALVQHHRGQITVESEEGKGTAFTVTVPVAKNAYSDNEIVSAMPPIPKPDDGMNVSSGFVQALKNVDSNEMSRKPVVLIVEDNLDMVDFMKEILEEKYHIYSAENGRVALEKLKHISPELIISDVMMPEMDGLEFTRFVKADLNTSHIPVVLLTAKSGFQNNLGGLKSGADFYIEKPFYPEILEQNIENILKTRKRTIERFKSDGSVSLSEIVYSESDRTFIEKLTSVVLSNISNPELDVTFLVDQMGVSRSLLHLKLKGLLDCSTTEFIRSVRLKEAVKLISSGKCNISEAAYETGFSNPAYFTTRFKEYYGKSPREYFNL